MGPFSRRQEADNLKGVAMLSRDYRDVIGGTGLLAIGLGVFYYCLTYLRLGSATDMGPGMFPAGVGVILAGFGAAILIPALFRAGPRMTVDIRSLAAALSSILAFALLLEPVGLVPAMLALTLIAGLADRKLSLLKSLLLAICLSILAILIFQVGLGMQVATAQWPW